MSSVSRNCLNLPIAVLYLGMAEQKHFHYEGHATLQKPRQVEVVDVAFLTPARITLKTPDGIEERNVGVDIINRKVYGDQGEIYSEQVFEYLDRVNSLPDNFFEASEEIYQQAAAAKDEHDQMGTVKEGVI